MKRSFLLSLALLVLAGTSLRADVKLPSIFGDNMVLQRDQPIPVWGWDSPDTEVTVTLGDAKATAKADANGKWSVSLPAQKSGGGPLTMSVAGKTTVEFKNVLLGEVWLCSGQSNMEWSVNASLNPQEESAAANFPEIRHIKFQHVTSDKPLDDAKVGGWQACSPQTAGGFTAVGYYFGRKLHQELKVPIGLIGSNWGGTRIEPWTPPVGFQQVPALKESFADKLDQFPQKGPNGNALNTSPMAIYNAMIHPIVGYGMRGAIWYQGESNNGEGPLYHEKMKALISGWRTIWKNPDMPFYFVQLAPYRYSKDPVSAQRLPGIWEAQTATLSVPNTGMAVTVDISTVGDIHPKNKQDVGKRLALWALAKTYGNASLVYSGPLFKSATVEGGKIRVAFDHVGGGLVSRDGKPLSWFQVAGENKEFKDATAEIDGNTVVVSSPDVTSPAFVRFGWNELAEPNLSNKEGLPASPFRTDK